MGRPRHKRDWQTGSQHRPDKRRLRPGGDHCPAVATLAAVFSALPNRPASRRTRVRLQPGAAGSSSAPASGLLIVQQGVVEDRHQRPGGVPGRRIPCESWNRSLVDQQHRNLLPHRLGQAAVGRQAYQLVTVMISSERSMTVGAGPKIWNSSGARSTATFIPPRLDSATRGSNLTSLLASILIVS